MSGLSSLAMEHGKCACGAPIVAPGVECEQCRTNKGLHAKRGGSNDALEEEADRISNEIAADDSARGASPPGIERLTLGGTAHSEIPTRGVERAIRSPTEPLEAGLRDEMEQRFGHDFSRVRVHSGPASEQSTRDLDAQAYTLGHHMMFGAGRYAPHTRAGRSLIAHELTHVLQQSDPAQSARSPIIQRKPDDKPKEAPPAKQPPKQLAKKGLSRTLYVVHNGVWASLPAAVRAGAEQQLTKLFAFVGAASTEKPFTISVVTPAQMPEQFDFSESVVSVIRGDAKKHVEDAFARQNDQIRTWLATQNVQMPASASRGKAEFHPERMGRGGASKTVETHGGRKFAMPVMAGAVDLDEVIETFFDNIDSMLEKQLKALELKGKDLGKWPQTLTKGSSSWQPLAMLGEALGRAIAHEARHEYVGAGHAEEGLGQEGAYIIGETGSAEFSKEDQKSMLDRIRKLEAEQGNATVVPTFPQSMRKKPDDVPF